MQIPFFVVDLNFYLRIRMERESEYILKVVPIFTLYWTLYEISNLVSIARFLPGRSPWAFRLRQRFLFFSGKSDNHFFGFRHARGAYIFRFFHRWHFAFDGKC